MNCHGRCRLILSSCRLQNSAAEIFLILTPSHSSLCAIPSHGAPHPNVRAALGVNQRSGITRGSVGGSGQATALRQFGALFVHREISVTAIAEKSCDANRRAPVTLAYTRMSGQAASSSDFASCEMHRDLRAADRIVMGEKKGKEM